MINKSDFVKVIYHQCGSCSREVYGLKAPNAVYALATRNLLFGTIAHESAGFTATRQHKFSWVNDRGAWGLAQCELGSVTESLNLLRRNKDLGKRAAVWVSSDSDATIDWLTALDPKVVLRALTISDRLSILFCRLHYFRVKEPIPISVEAQDKYYKQYYNTSAGAAKPGDFIKALNIAKSLV